MSSAQPPVWRFTTTDEFKAFLRESKPKHTLVYLDFNKEDGIPEVLPEDDARSPGKSRNFLVD